MENKSHIVAAVLFIVVFGAGAVIFYFWLSPASHPTRTYQVITDHSVDGLHAQSAVKYKGLKAGHVEKVDFDPKDPNKVQIIFVVRKGVPVTQASYVQLKTQGITGLKSLSLSNPNPKAAPLKTSGDNPAQIPLHQSLLARLENSGKQDLGKINAILSSVQQLLNKDNRKHLSQTLARIDEASARLAAAEKAAEPAFSQLPELTRQLQATIAQINKLATQAQRPVRQASGLEDSAQSLSDSIQDLVRRLNGQTLPRLDELTRTLNQTARHINGLSRELETRPQSVITGPPKPRPGPGEPGFKQSP